MLEEISRIFRLSAAAPHLEAALTHPSFANEQRSAADNQRLEFLGDAVLQFCISELLFGQFPDAAEGELTRRRAQLVNTEALADVAREIGLAGAMRLGKGAEANGLRDNTSVLADAVEALLAASFLDGGIEAARAASGELLQRIQRRLEQTPTADAKSELQERVQALGFDAPTYKVIESSGPPHQPSFRVSVTVAGQILAEGLGRSKRQAERNAAQSALGCVEVLQVGAAGA